MIKWCVAAGTETTLAGLASEGLDMSILATLPVADQRMQPFVSHPKIEAVWIQTGVALGLDELLPSASALLACWPCWHITVDSLHR